MATKFRYDPGVDAAYLQFYAPDELVLSHAGDLESSKLELSVLVDLSTDGRIAGIEFLNASTILPASLLKEGTT